MNKKKSLFFASSLMFCLYLFSTLVFSADIAFTKYSNLTGLALGVVFAFEVLVSKQTSKVTMRLLDLWPMMVFLVLVTGGCLGTGAGLGHAFTVAQILVLLSIAYCLCSITGKTWFVEYGLLMGLVYIWYSGAWRTSGNEFARFRFEVSGSTGGQLNPNVYSLYLSAYVLMAMRYVLIDYSSKIKPTSFDFYRMVIAASCSLLSVYEVFIRSGSRKGMLIMFLVAVGAATIIFRPELNFRKKLPYRKILVGGFFVLAMIYVGNKAMTSSRYTARLDRMVGWLKGDSRGDGSIQGRTAMAERGVELWLKSPLIGVGTQGFARRSGYGVYSHSNVIELLCNHGIVGFFFYYLLSLHVFLKVFPKVFGRNRAGRDEAIWVFILLSSLSIFELFAVTYYMKVVIVLLGVSVAFGLHPSPVQQQQKKLWFMPRRVSNNQRQRLQQF